MIAGKFANAGSFFVACERLEDVVIGPEARYCFTLSAGAPEASMTRQCVVVEIFLPRAGHFWSGLLGIRFMPSVAEDISVQVSYGETNKKVPSHLIAGSTLEVGMDQSFVAAVERGIRRNAGVLSKLGGGDLLIDMAAQNSGSSEYVFEILASILCSMLTGAVPVDRIHELLQSEFSPKRK